MIDKIDQIRENLLLENIYDSIRIVNPIKKTSIIIKDGKIENTDGTCYSFWRKEAFCDNCISMKAYFEKGMFVKIEYDGERIILVTATQISIDKETHVVEILKDISQNGKIFDCYLQNVSSVKDLIKEINEKAIIDELTGVYNREYIDQRLPVDVNSSIILGNPLSVIIVDIDSPKNDNDQFGDKIIKDFAVLINDSIRKNSDWVARYGENGFLIILNNTDIKSACGVAGRIKKMINNTAFKHNDANIHITTNFGVYSIEDEKLDMKKIIANLDKMLYEAKREGRDNTIFSNNIEMGEIDLSLLNKRIEELRDVLNEICLTADETGSHKLRLNISEYLDKLIVEYMKQIKDKNI